MLLAGLTTGSSHQPDLPSGRDAGTVDVWHAELDVAPERLSGLSRCLSLEEHARAARFLFEADRARFVAARGFLRHILSRYAEMMPERIVFGYAPQGKPFLPANRDLHFNLSHSDDKMIVAVAYGRRLGVDIERVLPQATVTLVSSIVLADPECRALQQVEASERREWFTRIWTRKEAYIKADGRGMGLRLDHIDVATSGHGVLLFDDDSRIWCRSPDWTIRPVPVAPGYHAALAAEGREWRPVCRS